MPQKVIIADGNNDFVISKQLHCHLLPMLRCKASGGRNAGARCDLFIIIIILLYYYFFTIIINNTHHHV